MTTYESADIKSIHIKESWPFQYVEPKRRVFSRATMDRANAQKREAYIRNKKDRQHNDVLKVN
jgi:hypothetical protein